MSKLEFIIQKVSKAIVAESDVREFLDQEILIASGYTKGGERKRLTLNPFHHRYSVCVYIKYEKGDFWGWDRYDNIGQKMPELLSAYNGL